MSGVRFFARTFLRTGTGGAGSGSSQAAGDMHRHTRVSVSLAGFSTGAYSGGAMDYIDSTYRIELLHCVVLTSYMFGLVQTIWCSATESSI